MIKPLINKITFTSSFNSGRNIYRYKTKEIIKDIPQKHNHDGVVNTPEHVHIKEELIEGEYLEINKKVFKVNGCKHLIDHPEIDSYYLLEEIPNSLGFILND